jgi:hypothetical protein
MAFDFSDEANITNKQLAGELAKVTPMTVDEINKLLVDKQRLAELISIVNSAAAENTRTAELTNKMGDLGGVVMKLLSTYLRRA